MTSPAKLKRLAVALAAIVTIAIAPADTPANAGLASGAVSPAQVQRIVAAIQVMRGLKFKTKVPISYLTPDAAAGRMKADIEHDRSKESIRLDTESGVMLGLYPPNVDLAGATIGMLKQQLGASMTFGKKIWPWSNRRQQKALPYPRKRKSKAFT